MTTNSNIEWTDATWNPVVGCSKVSPGCAHCYAETMARRLRAMALADIAAGRDPGRKRAYIDAVDAHGRWTGKLIPVPEALADPLGWRKPRRVFVNSMSDLFHEDVPHEFIAEVFAIMARAQQHVFQVLTKRAERMRLFCSNEAIWWSNKAGISREPHYGKPLPNGWLGVSVERHQEAVERIPHLLATPAAVRFLSCEPLLGPIDLIGYYPIDPKPPHYWSEQSALRGWMCGKGRRGTGPGQQGRRIDWVIVGGESGPDARPCDVGWIRSIVQQCKQAGVACFVKQLGAHIIDRDATAAHTCPPRECWPDGTRSDGQRILLHDPKGGAMEEWPEDLRVRQWPKAMEV